MTPKYEDHFVSEYFPDLYKVGDWHIVVRLEFNKYDNDYRYDRLGPFATSEEAVANAKILKEGTPFIFQIRDTEPK